jgi:hypothetical protein
MAGKQQEKGKLKFDFFGWASGKAPTSTSEMASTPPTIFLSKEKLTKIGGRKGFVFTGDDGKEQKVFIEFGLNYTPVLHDLAVGFLGIPLARVYEMSRGDIVRVLGERVRII